MNNNHIHPMFSGTINDFARLSAESPEDRLAQVRPEETLCPICFRPADAGTYCDYHAEIREAARNDFEAETRERETRERERDAW